MRFDRFGKSLLVGDDTRMCIFINNTYFDMRFSCGAEDGAASDTENVWLTGWWNIP